MKKGFTLIELLAVIIILAIILLIAFPKMSGIIENARKEGFLNSAKLIENAAELAHVFGPKDANGTLIVTFSNHVPNNDLLKITGKTPKEGEIRVNSNGQSSFAFFDGKYCAKKAYDGKITIEEVSEGECKLPDSLMFASINGSKIINLSSSADSYHYLALLENGDIYSWGWNDEGQLGLGHFDDQNTPQKIVLPTSSKVKQIAVGSNRSAILFEDGSLYLFGYIEDAGFGPTEYPDVKSTPELLSIGFVKSILGFSDNIFLLMEDDSVFVAGHNYFGALGLGHTNPVDTFINNPALTNVEKVVTSFVYNYFIFSDGSVSSCGKGMLGVLGHGNTNDLSVPTKITTLSNVKDVVTNSYSALAVLENGDTYVWGSNEYGSLGLNVVSDTHVETSPVRITSLANVVSASSGLSRFWVILENGDTYGWGDNTSGDLGVGFNSTAVRIPTKLPTLKNIDKLISSAESSFVIDSLGKYFVWGNNYYGQLGLQNNINYIFPTSHTYFNPRLNSTSLKASKVWAANERIYVQLENGDVYAWGWNQNGELGLGYSSPSNTIYTPQHAKSLVGLKDFSPGGYNSGYMITNDNNIYAWGKNDYGQLGLGDKVYRLDPTPIQSLSNAKKISPQSDYAIALLNDGNVYSWGSNFNGQLGLGDTSERLIPTKISSLQNVKIISTGDSEHSAAVLNNGDIYTWGSNLYGELGLGDSGFATKRLTPTKIPGLSNVKQVALDDGSSFAVLENGDVYSWGRNNHGQLGLGDTNNRSEPIQIPGLSNVKEIITGSGSSLIAIIENGDIYAWGYNGDGVLGLGDTENKLIPTLVNFGFEVASVQSDYNGFIILAENGDVYFLGPDLDWNYHSSPVLIPFFTDLR